MEFAKILTVPLYVDLIKVFSLGLIAFVFAILWTPFLTNILYKHFRTKTKKKTVTGEKAPVTKSLTQGKEGTPLMGGLIIWVTTIGLAVIIYLLGDIFPNSFLSNFNFLSRSQTWLPLFALVSTGMIGLMDDYFSCKGIGSNKGGGIRFLYRFLWLLAVAILGGIWFHYKLGYSAIHVPAFGDIYLGWLYIFYFVLIIIATAISSNETDGLDGLNGGVLFFAFASYGFISFFQHRIDLAALCAVISGGILAFLWFNINPARFFMGDTGAFSLGTTLGVVSLLTNTSLILPFIVFIYVVESLSVIIQLVYKKLNQGRKFFKAAPIHYHFRALGWPESKVVMRFWIISIVMCIIGVVIAFFGSGN